MRAVGKALSTWEFTEGIFAHLFATLIRPLRGSYAARRAYGSIQASRGRLEIIQTTAEVFFRNLPSIDLQADLKEVMKLYGEAGSRRNDIAHGLLMPSGPDGAKGCYLAASIYTTKRSISLESPYFYNAD